MIATQERVVRQEIFRSIRSSIQELHSDKVILEDVNGTPFLFKSNDAKVWARIFYRSMRDFFVEELQQEIKKLWLLMPDDAVLYLFFPALDRQQILKMNDSSDRLSFFEYAGHGSEKERGGVCICKWMPTALCGAVWVEGPSCQDAPTSSFLRHSKLTDEEVLGLTDLGLSLRRIGSVSPILLF